MEGRNYLEQLQFKKQAKKPPVINLDFGNKLQSKKTEHKPKTIIEKSDDEEEVEKPIQKFVEKETDGEPEIERRKEVQMKDLRGKVPIDYELIMKRLQTHNVTGVVDIVSKKPGVITSNAAITIPKPSITKTREKVVIARTPELAPSVGVRGLSGDNLLSKDNRGLFVILHFDKSCVSILYYICQHLFMYIFNNSYMDYNII